MNALQLKRLALRAELALQRGNPLLLASVGLCLLAVVMGLLLVPIWQARLQDQQSDLQQAQVGAQERQSTPISPVMSQDQRNLELFLSQLDEARSAEPQLQALFAMARGLAIGLPQGQYKMVCEDSGLLCNYRVQLPVKGTYAQLRAFVEEFLRVMPALSLDEVGFKRESVGDEELEVRLVMTLVVRAPKQTLATAPKVAP